MSNVTTNTVEDRLLTAEEYAALPDNGRRARSCIPATNSRMTSGEGLTLPEVFPGFSILVRQFFE